MKIKTKEDRRDHIKHRIRKRVSGTTERPRLTVFRSLAHMYAQVVDDRTGRAVCLSVLDNLGKGGAAQGIQDLNLMHGWDERTGLDAPPVYP